MSSIYRVAFRKGMSGHHGSPVNLFCGRDGQQVLPAMMQLNMTMNLTFQPPLKTPHFILIQLIHTFYIEVLNCARVLMKQWYFLLQLKYVCKGNPSVIHLK